MKINNLQNNLKFEKKNIILKLENINIGFK